MINTGRSIVFTNTYVAFIKYITFFKLGKQYMYDKLCYSYVNDKLRVIYNNGEIFYVEEHKHCKFVNKVYQNIFYAFLVTPDAVIFTDICRPSEWQAENMLLGVPENDSAAINTTLYHNLVYPGDHKNYNVVLTYNAFYAFADAVSEKADLGLNKALFKKFDACFDIAPFYEDIKNLGTTYPFKFVCFYDTIIIYDFSTVPFWDAGSTVSNAKSADLDGYYDEIDEGITIDDLEKMGAFTDEGIYPPGWD